MGWFRLTSTASACLLASLSLAAQSARSTPPPDPETALQQYLAEARSESENRRALDNLYQSARESLKEGLYQDAEGEFRALYRKEPGSPRGICGVAEVYVQQQREDDAVEVVQSEIRRRPTHQDLIFCLADIATSIRRPDAAIATLTTSTRRFAADPHFVAGVLVRIGSLDVLKKDYPAAISAFRRASLLWPSDSSSSMALAQALEESGQADDALAVYNKLLGVDPTDPDALLACFRNQSFDRNVTRICIERAHQLRPDDPDVTAGFASTLIGTKAESIFEDLLARFPENSSYHLLFSTALLQIGNVGRGLEELNAALKYETSDDKKSEIERRITLIQLSQQRQAK